MILDANILLYAVDETSPFHAASLGWLEPALNGDRRVGLPWSSLWAFVRIATHPRALTDPLLPAEALQIVDDWLAAPAAWVPSPGRGHAALVAGLLTDLDLRGNLVPDAVLAALCMEHGVPIVSADSDVARFPDLEWVNPLT